jgi:hypothetical protein
VAFEVTPPAPRASTFTIAERGGSSRTYDLVNRGQGAYLAFYEALAGDFGLRRPLASAPVVPQGGPPLRALLTEPLAPEILYGYGDPCVVRLAASDYRLLVTSNDAPNAFPILSSPDLKVWGLTGFVFPEGRTPDWTLTGADRADFWAPEMHRVGAEYWVCFAARAQDASLCIGMARSLEPDGPFAADPQPIVRGGVIDPHILVDSQDAPWLIWKKDDNDVWPRGLSALLHRNPGLVAELFKDEPDRRTAAFVLTLWPWSVGLTPMEQFFVQQPLIEAVTTDFSDVGSRLAAIRGRAAPELAAEVAGVLAAMKTRIYAQRLSFDGRRLVGDPHVILENDRPWEAHLIEGVWITEEAGRYYLLYAGNDFSTAHYGIGVAVAPSPVGPYVKADEVFLSSTSEWWGPGHPSVAVAPDGRRHIFLHAFRPGRTGYKAYRALLAAPLLFEDGAVRLADPL